MPRPGLIPARNHWCLHNDQLAQEFDGILNLTQTFPGCAKSPEGSIFYAPLSSNLNEVVAGLPADYNRPLEALYERTPGQWAIAADGVPRFESGRLLMEPATTNKCENYNANPDAGLTGLTLSGDGAAVLSRISDPAAIAAAGLSAVCTDGFVIRLDNSAGVGQARVNISGIVGNTNTHTISAWARKISGANDAFFRLNDNSITAPAIESIGLERIAETGTPGSSGVLCQLLCNAGVVADIVLNQLEESEALSTPIITRGASASRGADVLFYSDFDTVLSQSEGMLLFDWFHRGDSLVYGPTGFYQDGKITFNTSITGPARYVSSGAGPDNLQSSDGGTGRNFTLTQPIFNVLNRCCIYWQGAIFGQGVQRDSGAWEWGPTYPYDGDWPGGLTLNVGVQTLFPWRCSNIGVWDEWKGQTWVEDNLSS